MSHSSDEQKRPDLEQRFAAYYGPRLREQPLPQDAWQQLRRKLDKPARRHMRLHGSIRSIHRRWFHETLHPVPEYVYTTFNRVAYDARVSYSSSLLHCTFKRKLRVPNVHISPLRKQPIRLLLPVDTERSLPAPGLNVLLAAGIARYQLVKNALWISLLLTGSAAIGGGVALFYALHNHLLLSLLIVAPGGLFLLFLLERRKRHLCYAADTLVVLWIGRGRTCEGLHVLAHATHFWQRGRWGEPSMAARIARVCGTRVESENERLTMVR